MRSGAAEAGLRYIYIYISCKNEILKKKEDVGKRLGGYWEEVGRTTTNRRNAMRRAEANAKWGGHWILNRNYVAYVCICIYIYVSYKNEILKKREDVG